MIREETPRHIKRILCFLIHSKHKYSRLITHCRPHLRSLYRTGLDHCAEDGFNSRGADIGKNFANLCFGKRRQAVQYGLPPQWASS